MKAQRAALPQRPPRDLSSAPPGPRIPRHLLGAAYNLREHELLRRCRRRYGPVFSLNVWPVGLMILLADPAEVKRIFTGDPQVLHAGEGNAIALPVAGPQSILMVDDEHHLRRRRLMLPPFHGERLGVYANLIEEIADAEIDRWPLRTEFPIHSGMQAITLRVILRGVLGVEDAPRRAQLERLIPELINSRILLWPFLQRDLGPLSPWRRFDALRERVDALLFEEIESKRGDPDLARNDDVLSMLLQARDEQGEPMDDCELRDQLVTLLLAGHETSATALAWAFERLLRNPATLARLRSSLVEGDEAYLEGVIKETLRVRPIVGVALRRLTASLPIAGYTAPAGSLLAASMILLHNDPEIYPEPLAFRPERFLENSPDTYSWIPFGGGLRRCLGAAFAMLEMKIVLRRVLERCDLHAPRSPAERPRRRFVTYAPNAGARVLLERRVAAPRSPIPSGALA